MNIKKLRKDFPILQKKISGKFPIYFDNACQTLRPKNVIDKILEYYTQYPACGGRSIHKWGDRTTKEFEHSREIIAKLIGAEDSKEIIFTKNTTEGLNLVAHSLNFKKGDIVLGSDREHNSNLIPWQILTKTKGIKHKIVPSKSDSTFDLEKFKFMVKGARLVSIIYTSNIDGYTLPVKEIIKTAHDHGALVMLDAAQTIPHKEIDAKKLDVDFLAFSGHKMLGPSGTGILYGKYHLLEELNPIFTGGGVAKNTTYTGHELLEPPEKFEAGLQNYAGMIGLGEAAKYLMKVGLNNIEKHELELNKIATEGLLEIDGSRIIGIQDYRLRSGVISFGLDGIHSHDICMILDDTENIMIRSGSHCVHSWFNSRGIQGSARASFYLYNTKEEVEKFVDALKKVRKAI
ncbi:MAG: selenocysteine lyase [Candidatus Aenigmarchaeota archaeon CG_4_10_14_3_um_filter_37_21]|nr:MAG: selenocysteine lyase [Candidatus Aenigmarchaeota archaeon CG_4_10_14_3_um_filter_37_21]